MFIIEVALSIFGNGNYNALSSSMLLVVLFAGELQCGVVV